jgi:biotin carboxylase
LADTLLQTSDIRILDTPFEFHQVLAQMDRELQPHEKPLVATNDEYLVPLARQIQAHLEQSPQPDLTAFRDKRIMKDAVSKAGLRVPRSISLENVEGDALPAVLQRATENLGFPLVAKPASEANSRGVVVLGDQRALQDWHTNSAYRENIILEKHVNGRLFFCDTLIEPDGSKTVLMVCEYANPPHLFGHGSAHGSRTLDRNDPLYRRISQFNTKALNALPDIRSTITHLEVFLTPNDELVFLEVAARAPGAWVARIGERHIGINLEELNFRLQFNLPYHVPRSPLSHAAWLWFPKRSGRIATLRLPDIPYAHRVEWTVAIGDTCQTPPTGGPNLPDNAACRIEFWDEEADTIEKLFKHLRGVYPCVLETELGNH